ncbi:hypothetical protein Acr_17g0008670 [Actinidia rufa]|uniref:Uncharacterized protein n=1 Tax=Actinidia rufa TaxID=165716 RepID=A0A7J0G3C9_9ERIC|nr:hypothetical protein Acr_17g0008670 [Actinidia rufa]
MASKRATISSGQTYFDGGTAHTMPTSRADDGGTAILASAAVVSMGDFAAMDDGGSGDGGAIA